MEQSIDFVITWVDGNDTAWQKKREIFLKQSKNKSFNGNNSSVRYRDYGVLRYLLRSIEMYAPWVRKIFLVTDGQRPQWLKENSKLILVNHKDFINKKFLPLFNSNAIEFNLDKIPGLSENFVYFNDDMVLNKPTQSTDYFKNNLPCDFRIYSDIIPLSDFDHIPLNNNILINQFIDGNWPISKHGIISKTYGKHQLKELVFLAQAKKRGIPGYMEPHGPLSLKKSTFKTAREIWPKEYSSMSTHRFRESNDISLWLLRHLQLELGLFYPSSPDSNAVYTVNDIDLIKKDFKVEKTRSLCINDEDIIDFESKAIEIKGLLEQKYKHKSKFEK